MSRWKRTWWVVFISNVVTAVGMMSFIPFFPSILEGMGVTDVDDRMVWAGVLYGAAPLLSAIMGPVWGSFGDRYGRKLMVVRALVAIALFVGAMAFARTPWELLALRLGQGAFSGFIPPSITLASLSAPREIQGRVTGALQAALPAGMIIGPIAGHFAMDAFGPQALFLSVSAAAGLSALLVACFASEDASLRLTVERFSPTSVLSHTLRDLRSLFESSRIRWALAALFATQFGLGATNPQLELFVAEVSDRAPEANGNLTAWLFSAYAISGLIASPLWGRLGDRIGHDVCLLIACVTTAGFLAFQALATVYGVLLAGRVLIGLSSPGTNISAYGMATTETEQARRGGAFGAVYAARTLAVSIGSMVGGVVGSAVGIRGLFLGVAVAITVTLLVLRLRAGPRLGADSSRQLR